MSAKYVERSGILEKLRSGGYELKLDSANNEATAVDIDGWEVVTEQQPDGTRVCFKIHDHPAVGGYMILLKRKR